MGLVDHFLESTVGVYSPLLILMTTENFIDTIWHLSKDLQRYIIIFSKHKDKLFYYQSMFNINQS